MVSISESGLPTSQARVKNVLSGDTLVLTSLTEPRRERTLSLAFVSAPRMRREGDEPFAVKSREFLRRQLVGRVIQFNVVYTIPTGAKREYGVVTMQNGAVLPLQCLKEGTVKVRNDGGRRDDTEFTKTLMEKFKDAEAMAKTESVGLWASVDGRVETVYEVADPQAFLATWKGKPIESVVERVITGDRIIVRLLLEPARHVQTLVLIAGVRAPMTKRIITSDDKEQPGEPLGEEAQAFVEERLLQRNVKVEILGVSPQNQLISSVIHPNGNIAVFLLEDGLARCIDHHSTILGGEMAKLRQAERLAKDRKKGLFKDHVGVQSSSGDLDAIVCKVQTADTLYIRNKAGKEKRISLSSIRQPKPGDASQAVFQADAKEFLRKRIIGKHVKVTIDGKRPASEGYEERDVATVMYSNKSIALVLVESGFASVIRHRRDDDDRSPYYDELLAAEEVAIKEQKGMWSPKPPKTTVFVDYSESVQKAKIQASMLQRQRRIPAIVDFVKGGSRFTILVPRENVKLTLVLSCVRTPRSARSSNETSEPFGQEAHDFASRRCLQRDVEIDVEGNDKFGGFIGSLYVNRENFAKLLLEEGLATVHTYSAEHSNSGPELIATEQKAKAARKGLWHDYDPSQGDEDSTSAPTGTNEISNGDGTAAAVTRKLEYKEVIITHIDPNTLNLKLQLIGTGTTGALEELMGKFRAFHLSPQNSTALPTPPKAGDVVAAKFSEDGSWYRARIRRNDREAKSSEVVYVDFGNEEKVPWTNLRPLSQPQFSFQALKPQASDAVLAYCQFSTSKEYVDDAFAYLNAQINGAELVANVEFTDGRDNKDVRYVTLFHKDMTKGPLESVNADVVAEGLAMVPRKLKAWERHATDLLADLTAREREAQANRKGMWEYGDLTQDDGV